jgi:hypothetical protein
MHCGVSDTSFDDDCRRLMTAIVQALEKAQAEKRESQEKEGLERESREREEKARLEIEQRLREEKERLEAEQHETKRRSG